MQHQAGCHAAFGPERQPFAERQHVGRQRWRQFHQNAFQAADFKPHLGRRERIERTFCRDQYELRRVHPERRKAQTIRPAGFGTRGAILHPQDGA
jgi:hypothetical protein